MQKTKVNGGGIFRSYGSKEGNDAGILLDSKTVLEKKDFVSTGVLTYALGDIIEIEIPQYQVFELGDKVKLTVYTQTGLFVFHSSVVAKDHGSVIVINPPENRKKFTEKREYPRIDIAHQGWLLGMRDVHKQKQQKFENPLGISLKNISMGGIGFTIEESLTVDAKFHLELELHLGFPLSCVTEIVRKETTDLGIYYGAMYIDVPSDKMNALRAFILKRQVESYFVQKREDNHRKALEKGSAVNE